jgi:hypothetical protein
VACEPNAVPTHPNRVSAMSGLSWLPRDPTVPALVGVVSLAAWIVLWQLGHSPSGGGAHDHGAAGHEALSAASTTALGATFVLSWIVMTAAMMLPTTIPLLQIFRRLTMARSDRATLLLLVVLGYLAAWAACGVIVFGAARAIHMFASGSAWLVANPQIPTGAPPRRRRLSVLGDEISLSRQMPVAAQFRDQPLARQPRAVAFVHARRRARRVLRRLLLGADAADVCDGHGEPAVDGRARRGDGGREERSVGATTFDATGRRAVLIAASAGVLFA